MSRLIAAILATLLLSSCRKSHNEPQAVILPELRAFYSYGPGSYWIMQDTVTGNIDSIAVVNKYSAFRKTSGVIYESIVVDMHAFSMNSGERTGYWYLTLDVIQNARLQFRSPDQKASAWNHAIHSPPAAPTIPALTQGATTFTDVYESSGIGGSTAYQPEDGIRTWINGGTGFIRLDVTLDRNLSSFRQLRSRIVP